MKRFFSLLLIVFFAFFPIALCSLLLPDYIAVAKYGSHDQKGYFFQEQVSKIHFRDDKALKSTIARIWIEHRSDVPALFPQYRIAYQGTIMVPEVEDHSDVRLLVKTSVPFELFIDGKSLIGGGKRSKREYTSHPLAAGEHELSLIIDSTSTAFRMKTKRYFTIHMTGKDKQLLAVPWVKEAPFLKTVAWSYLILFPIVFLVLRYAPGINITLSALCKQHIDVFCMATLFLLACFLRMIDYTIVPSFLETADEYNNIWIGYHLLHEGTPRGWGFESMVGEGEKFRWFGDHFNLIPTKFHPMPSFALLVGFVTALVGAEGMFQISLAGARLVPIMLSSFTACMVYVVARKLMNTSAGFFAGLFYAVLPLAILNGRLVKDDNLLAFVSITTFAVLLSYHSKPTGRKLFTLSTLSGFACVIKQTGIFVPAAVGILLVREKMWRSVIAVIASMFFFYLFYLGYGYFYDWDQFIRQISYLGNLRVDFGALSSYFTKDLVAHTAASRGVMTWLWFTFVLYAYQENKALSIFVLMYLLVICLARMDGAVYGWYMIVFFPFFSITAVHYIKDWYQKSSLLHAVPFVFLMLYSSLDLFDFGDGTSTTEVRFAMVTVLTPYVLCYCFPNRYMQLLSKGSTILLVLGALVAQLYYIYHAQFYY